MSKKTYQVWVRAEARPAYSPSADPVVERYALADELPPDAPRSTTVVDAEGRTWLCLGLGANAPEVMRRLDAAAAGLRSGLTRHSAGRSLGVALSRFRACRQ